MSCLRLLGHRILQVFFLGLVMALTVESVQAQEMMGGRMSCPMCGAMGWAGMLLALALALALIAALVALTVFLVRRSRHQH